MYTLRVHVHVHVHDKVIMGQARQRSLDSSCFEPVSSHQQGIHITCLAHHPALYTQGETESDVQVQVYWLSPVETIEDFWCQSHAVARGDKGV